MSQSDRAIKKFATQLARLDREVKSWRGAQADFTSIENGGNFTFKDADGNVTAIMGGQDDGSNTIRHVDGPTPPIPSGLSAHVDGPIVQVSWDGTFEDADTATWDWSHLEVVVVGPSNEQLTATINDVTGATANLAATVSGEWVVVARSVSRAEKRSLDGDAGTVEVKLVDIDGAIEAVQDSANGKNKVTYSSHAPTPADPGIFDDTWFVGQVGRPNDIIEATNLAPNPSFEGDIGQNGIRISSGGGSTSELSTEWSLSGSQSVKNTPTGSSASAFYPWINSTSVQEALDATIRFKPGGTYTVGVTLRLTEQQVAPNVDARKIIIGTIIGGSSNYVYALSQQAPNEAGEHRLSVTFTVPDNAMMFIRLMNGSTVTPAWWDGLTIEEGATSGEYFDGDTENGATQNESHYRWTGTPHASTSEKYLPALTIGDSDNWNIIEQYRHDGTGWVKVELSHHVFSTVDLGKATVGELDGIRIMGRTVRGEQLSGDAIDGKVITGPTIQSAREGQRWVGDTTGIRIFNADNEVRTKLSPDDSVFKGEVEADTLIVNGGSELRSAENKLGQGAKLTLAAGVTDPTAPPVVQPYWDGVEFDMSWSASANLSGLAFDGTNYWTVKTTGAWIVNGVTGLRAIRITPTGGHDLYSLDGASQGFSEFFGVTCIGSELFWLYRSGYEGRILVTDLNCVKKREMPWSLGYSKTNPLTYKPGIGNDGTNIVIAHCTDSGRLDIHTCNKTTGALTSTVNDSADRTRSDITGVYVGNADWGRKLATIAKKSNGKLPSFNPTTGVYDGASTQFNAAETESVGVVFHDGKFHTLAQSGKIHEYAAPNMGDDSNDWWATYRWSVDADDDGTNESISRIGPAKRFTWPNRSKLRFLGAPLPAGVGYITPSIARKSTTPSRTDFRTPNFRVYVGKSQAWYDSLPTDWQSGPAPSGSNDFPTAEPSTLVSASSTFQVNGDGSGRWGPLTFNPDGTMSSSAVPEWVPITTFKSGFSAYSFGFAPAYRIWPDGKVEWRGIVGGPIDATGITPIVTIPSAARPALSVNATAATSGGPGTAVTRVEFSGTNSPTDLTVTGNQTARVWVSLDGIYYYKN